MADEADIDEDDGQDSAPQPKKSRLKLVLIAAAGLVVLGGGAAAAYVFLGDGLAGGADAETAEVEETYFYDLPEMTVNLNTQGEQEQFLKLTVSLEVKSEAALERIEPRVTRVVDAFQVYLRELRRSDLEGSAGIYRLKEELRRRVNLAVHPTEVDNILFREILVQ